jgi:hypothetical protein
VHAVECQPRIVAFDEKGMEWDSGRRGDVAGDNRSVASGRLNGYGTGRDGIWGAWLSDPRLCAELNRRAVCIVNGSKFDIPRVAGELN